MKRSSVVLCVLFVTLVAVFFAFDLRRDAIASYVAGAPLASAALFFTIYVAVTGLSLPGAAVLTIIAGALFGVIWGTLLVSFASSIGATLAFLTSRLVLRDWIQRRLGKRLEAVNEGVRNEGAFYLFALRLVPAFPFFVINLAMGLTPMRAFTFYWVSQIGMLPATIVYVYAGTQLGEFKLRWQLLLALALIGIFPLAAKRALHMFKSRRTYARMD